MRTIAGAYVALLLGIVLLADVGAIGPLLRFVHAVPWMDKIAHFAFATVLGVMIEAASRSRGRALVVVAVCVLIEELSQRLVPGRTFDLFDLAADALGLVGGTTMVVLFRRRTAPASETAST